jgi:hypothetical protein
MISKQYEIINNRDYNADEQTVNLNYLSIRLETIILQGMRFPISSNY